jgi:membrane-bound ClpP family serine protease
MMEILMKKKTSLSKFGMAIMIAGGVLLALWLAVGDLSVLSVSSSVLIIVSGFLLYRSQSS